MGYPSHVKKTSKGLRYRVWSTIVDAYISDEMTEAELREFELVRQTQKAVENIWRDMDRQISDAEVVRRWEREQKFDQITEEEYEKMCAYMASLTGARVDVNLENKADGSKVLAVKIKPVLKQT